MAHDHKHFQDTNRYYSTKTCEQPGWSEEMSWPEVCGIALQLAQGHVVPTLLKFKRARSQINVDEFLAESERGRGLHLSPGFL